MLKCPECNHKIPYWKPWFLTNFNTIACPACGKRLGANKSRNSLMGAIGGVSGALILMSVLRLGLSMKALALLIIWVVCLLFATSLFTKLEVK